MLFSRNNKPTPIEVACQATSFEMDALVLVCDTFLIFKNDMAVYQWAAEILKEINSVCPLTTVTKVEAVVGYKGDKQVLHANMQDLINLMLTRMGLPPDKHVIKFFEKELQMPPMRIWGATAIRINSTQTYDDPFTDLGNACHSGVEHNLA